MQMMKEIWKRFSGDCFVGLLYSLLVTTRWEVLGKSLVLREVNMD